MTDTDDAIQYPADWDAHGNAKRETGDATHPELVDAPETLHGWPTPVTWQFAAMEHEQLEYLKKFFSSPYIGL